LPSRRTPPPTSPDLPPEKAYAVLSSQLKALEKLKGRSYGEAQADEDEWENLTEKLTIRAFGGDSTNVHNFYHARSAGVQVGAIGRGVDHFRRQANFVARIKAYEAFLKSCLSELEIDLPEDEIKGVYEPGQEYEFYRDVKAVLEMATREIFIIDPYINAEMFEAYADSIPRTISFRLLTNSANIPPAVLSLAQKYAAGGNLRARSSTAIHDRVLFADGRVWVCGQSLKDAAKKKPTYIVEHDGPLMRGIYEDAWANATPLV
jgi:hypothetical protein